MVPQNNNKLDPAEDVYKENVKALRQACEGMKSDIEQLKAEKQSLQEKYKELETAKNNLQNDIYIAMQHIDEKADTSLLETKTGELSRGLNGKADKSQLESLSSDIQILKQDNAQTNIKSDNLRGEHRDNTCIFLCTIIIFNILAIWLIIYRPGYADSVITVDELPWFFMLPLIACTLLNIAGTVIWLINYCDGILEMIVEIGLLILNTVTMWLFAFHPLATVTDAIIALAVFLMLTNILIFIMRVHYFTSGGDIDSADIPISLIGTGFLIAAVICFICFGCGL